MSPIVLVGGGQHHYLLLQSLDDQITKQRPVILVSNDTKVLPQEYLPLALSKGVSANQLSLDLWSVCQKKSVYFLEDECVHIDRETRRIHLKNFGKLNFQSLSIETGLNEEKEKKDHCFFDASDPVLFIEKMNGFFNEVHKHCPREVRIVIDTYSKESIELAAVIKNQLKPSCEVCDIVLLSEKDHSELGLLSREKKPLQKLKESQIRLIDNVTIGSTQTHQLKLSNEQKIPFDIFISLKPGLPTVLEKSIGYRQGHWSVGRDLCNIKDSEIYISGSQVHFEREDRWISEITKEEVNKVLLHNIFIRNEDEPTISCRDQLAVLETGIFTSSVFAKDKHFTDTKIKKWQKERLHKISELQKISVSETSQKSIEATLSYQAEHMSRPWHGLVSRDRNSAVNNFRLISFNGFNNWGSYGSSTIKICEMALMKALTKGIKAKQLRFNLTLPRHKSHLTQHIFESSFKAIELVCEKYGIDIDGGDTFDGSQWHLMITLGGEVLFETKSNIQPHDYLLMTRPLGYGLLWAGRTDSSFDSRWIDQALKQTLLPSIEAYNRFTEKFQPSDQIFIEEWGFLYHCLEKLPKDQQIMINFREVPRWQGIDRLINKTLSQPGLESNWERIQKDVAFTQDEVSRNNDIMWDSLSQGAVVIGVNPQNWQEALQDLKKMGFTQGSLVGCTRPKSKGNRVVLTDWSP